MIQLSNVALSNLFFNSFTRKEDVLTAFRRLSHKGGRPLKIGAALKCVKTAASMGRYNAHVQLILVVFSNASSSDSVYAPVASLKESSVTILTIKTNNSELPNI